MPKILALGNFSSAYIDQNWGSILRERPDTLVVDTTPLLAEDDYRNTQAIGYVQSLARSMHFQWLFFYADGLLPHFPAHFFASLKAIGIRIAAYHADDEPEQAYALNSRYDRQFDVIVTCSKRAHLRRSTHAPGPQSIYLPWGYNPRYFYPLPESKKRYDLIFIGKYKQGGETSLVHEDGPVRHAALIELAQFSRQHQLRFAIFGIGWDQDPVLKTYYQGILTHASLLQAYSETKIVFNPGWSFDECGDSYQTKLRHFEVAGCGALQISNVNPELAELFTPGHEIVFYHDVASLKQLILHFVTHHEERIAIATAGLRRAQNQHTMPQRINQLVNALDSIGIPAPSKRPALRERPIVQLCLGTAPGCPTLPGEVQPLRVGQATDRQLIAQLPDDAFIHCLDQDTCRVLRHLDYRPVIQALSRCRADLVTMNTLVRLSARPDNPVQIDRNNFNGTIWREPVTETAPAFPYCMPLLRIAHRQYRIPNLLFAKPFFLKLLPQILNIQQTIAIESAKIQRYNRIVNEIFLEDAEARWLPWVEHCFSRELSSIDKLEARYMVYGARGELLPMLLRWIVQYPRNFAGFIDRALAGETIKGYPIYSAEDLPTMNPEHLFIAATQSGPAIMEMLQPHACNYRILPLYDLSHGNWGYRDL